MTEENITLHGYVDQLIDNTDGKFDSLSSCWFTVPREWAGMMAKNQHYNTLEQFLCNYTYDTTQGWLDAAITDGVLIGAGVGVMPEQPERPEVPRPLYLYVMEILDEKSTLYAAAAPDKETAKKIAMEDHKATEGATESARVDETSVRWIPNVIGPNNFYYEIAIQRKDTTLCPHCFTTMAHHIREGHMANVTHIYTCENCPNVMIEYSSTDNLKALARYLNEDPAAVVAPAVKFCPHGTEQMEYTLQGRTHIYSCPECPNIMFEYGSWENIVDLIQYLEEGNGERMGCIAHMLEYYISTNKPNTLSPADPVTDDWLQIVKDPTHPCTLNGFLNDAGDVEYVVEINGITDYHHDLGKAMGDYIRRLTRYVRETR